MKKLINADSNGISRTIVAQYGAKRYSCLLRNDGFGITGVMEEIEPKIVGYTRDKKGVVVKRSLRDTSKPSRPSQGADTIRICMWQSQKLPQAEDVAKDGNNNSKSMIAERPTQLRA